MEFIISLRTCKFNVFNVNDKKEPIDYMGEKLKDWPILTSHRLTDFHDIKSNMWGLRMGEQDNGRYLLSLDFDICGEKDPLTGERTPCEIARAKYNDYREGIKERLDGLYSSSTVGNFNVLVDITNSPILKDLCQTLETNKFNYHGLEVLIGNGAYQVIPPTATTCKTTFQKGNPRTFFNDKPFYIINEEENCFLLNFIKSLMLNEITTNKKKLDRKKKEQQKQQDKEDNKKIKEKKSEIILREKKENLIMKKEKTIREKDEKKKIKAEEKEIDEEEKFLNELHYNLKNDKIKIDEQEQKIKTETEILYERIEYYINGGLFQNLTSYKQWVNIATILKFEFNERGINLFKLISSKYPAYYNEVGCEAKYADIHPSGKITFGSLIYSLKQENLNLYQTLTNEYYNKTMNIIKDDITDSDLANYFKVLYGDNWLFFNQTLYFYNGVYWEKDDKLTSRLINFIDKHYYKLLEDYALKQLKELNEEINGVEDLDILKEVCKLRATLQKFLKFILNLKSNKKRKNIIDDILIFLTNNKIVMDENPFYFTFENRLYDLEKGEFIDPKPEYYISMTCGYDFNENYNVENVEIMKNIIASILPAEDIRDYYLSILATGLCGIQIENFIIATGGGGNGKSLLNLYAVECIGNYAYILPNDFLTSPLKSGCDPQTANIAKKRLVLSQEPQGNQKIKASTMKEITGNQKINARGLYSDKCDDKFLTLTLIMECNKCPLIDEVNEAINRRIRLVPFTENFKCENEFNTLTEEEKIGVSIANPKYKEPRFYKEMRQALFLILINYFKAI